jgi:phosphatidylserine decarboxylase
MLDSLGSTLTPETINKFFSRFGKNPLEDVITIDQAIQCLEEEVCRPHSEKKRISMEDVIPDTTLPTPRTPALTLEILTPALEKLDFTGPSAAPAPGQSMSTAVEASKPFPVTDMEPNQQPITVPAIVPTCDDDASPTSHEKFPSTSSSAFSSDADEDAEGGSEIPSGSGGSGNSSPETTVERVINIKTCPLCHRPRLNSKAEMDIVTHLAVCASQDWAKVDRIVVGNFVTASQAQRKWYTRIITKVSSGAYQLGAVSLFFPSLRFYKTDIFVMH